jgi:hypothetical protein
MRRLKPPQTLNGEMLQHVLLLGMATILASILILHRDRSVPDAALLLSAILGLIGIDQIPLHELTRSIDVKSTLLGRERFTVSPLGAACQVLSGVLFAVYVLLKFFW